MINIIIDVILVAFILLLAFVGYKKGLMEFAFKILSFVIAIVLAFVLFKPVSAFIIKYTPLNDIVSNRVQGVVNSHMNENKENEENKQKEDSSNLPVSFSNYIDKTITDTSKKVQNDIANTVTTHITSTIINIFSFIVVFLLTKLILFLIHVFSDAFSKLPVIKQFNEMGGLIFGLLEAFLIIFILLAIISFLPLDNVKDIINNTYVTQFLYNYNPILWIFTKI